MSVCFDYLLRSDESIWFHVDLVGWLVGGIFTGLLASFLFPPILVLFTECMRHAHTHTHMCTHTHTHTKHKWGIQCWLLYHFLSQCQNISPMCPCCIHLHNLNMKPHLENDPVVWYWSSSRPQGKLGLIPFYVLCDVDFWDLKSESTSKMYWRKESLLLLTCFLSRHLLSNKTFVLVIHFDLVKKKVSEDLFFKGDLKKKTTIPNLWTPQTLKATLSSKQKKYMWGMLAILISSVHWRWGTHHKFKLVHVLGLATAVLDLLGEEEAHIKEEEATLSAFADDLLGVPDGEGILQQDFPQCLKALLQAVEHGEMHGIIGLLRHIHHHL